MWSKIETPSGNQSISHAPSSKSRKDCWTARDAYFECLDKNGLWLDGVKPKDYNSVLTMDLTKLSDKKNPMHNLSSAKKSKADADLLVCRELRALYENQCLPSWVVHFNTERLSKLKASHLANKIEAEIIQTQNDGEFWEKVKKKEK